MHATLAPCRVACLHTSLSSILYLSLAYYGGKLNVSGHPIPLLHMYELP